MKTMVTTDHLLLDILYIFLEERGLTDTYKRVFMTDYPSEFYATKKEASPIVTFDFAFSVIILADDDTNDCYDLADYSETWKNHLKTLSSELGINLFQEPFVNLRGVPNGKKSI